MQEGRQRVAARTRRRATAVAVVVVLALLLALSVRRGGHPVATRASAAVASPEAGREAPSGQAAPAPAPPPVDPAATVAEPRASAAAAGATPGTIAVAPPAAASSPPPSPDDEAGPADAGADTDDDTGTVPTGPRYAVEHQERTFTDPSRPTPARGDEPGYDGRTLRTLVVRPVGAAGPLPLVVFAHGYDSEPEVYERLLDAWAGAGYLVAAPEMPGSARDFPGEPTEGDIGQQARDLSFVITSVLNADMGADPNDIAVAGHSDGGSTVATLALDDDFADPRIDAYLVLSGGIPDDVDGSWGTTAGSGPMLVTVGQNDEYGDVPDATKVYDLGGMPKGFLLVPGGDHLNLYIGGSAVDESMRATTVGFLDGVLRRDADALRSLHLTRQSGLVHS